MLKRLFAGLVLALMIGAGSGGMAFAQSGVDVRLAWRQTTEDTSGVALTPAAYRIYINGSPLLVFERPNNNTNLSVDINDVPTGDVTYGISACTTADCSSGEGPITEQVETTPSGVPAGPVILSITPLQ